MPPLQGESLTRKALGDREAGARLGAQDDSQRIVAPDAQPTCVPLDRGPHDVTRLAYVNGMFVDVGEIKSSHAATVSPERLDDGWGGGPPMPIAFDSPTHDL